VFVGKRRLNECPKLSIKKIEEHSIADTGHNSIQQQMEETLAQLKLHITSVDFAGAAQRIDASSPAGNKLTIRCLGKNFTVDKDGNIETDIHVNPWLAIPILNYIIDGKGVPLSNNWVSFRDLPNGRSRYPLFAHRCEESLRKLADSYTNLFEDMLDIFDGKQLSFYYPCDIVVVLHPLPLIPVLICYLKPEDDMNSELKIFLDASSEENLDIESIYKLVTGIVMMFEKLAIRHS
jgi:hypothetical protein